MENDSTNTSPTPEETALVNSFGFSYVGGGHFRAKGVPKGISAETFHGNEIVLAVIRHVLSAANAK